MCGATLEGRDLSGLGRLLEGLAEGLGDPVHRELEGVHAVTSHARGPVVDTRPPRLEVGPPRLVEKALGLGGVESVLGVLEDGLHPAPGHGLEVPLREERPPAVEGDGADRGHPRPGTSKPVGIVRAPPTTAMKREIAESRSTFDLGLSLRNASERTAAIRRTNP